MEFHSREWNSTRVEFHSSRVSSQEWNSESLAPIELVLVFIVPLTPPGASFTPLEATVSITMDGYDEETHLLALAVGFLGKKHVLRQGNVESPRRRLQNGVSSCILSLFSFYFTFSDLNKAILIHIMDDCCWEYPWSLMYPAKTAKNSRSPRRQAVNTSFWLGTRNYSFSIISLRWHTSIWP